MKEQDERGYDVECVELIDAMNSVPGITTGESCCGHGDTEFRIWFTVDDHDSLPPLLYWFAACHSGVYWPVMVKTDCAMSPAVFYVESISRGPAAYEEAAVIARAINDAMAEAA